MEVEQNSEFPGGAERTLERWRHGVLERCLALTFTLAVLVTLGVALQELVAPARLSLVALPPITALGLGLAWRRGPIHLRAILLSAGLLTGVALAGMHRGFSLPNPFTATLLACVMAALVLPIRGAWLVTGAAIGVWAGVAALHLGGSIAMNPALSDPADPRNWTRIVVTFALLAASVTGSVRYVVSRLERAVRRSERLRHTLARHSQNALEAARSQERLQMQVEHLQRVDTLSLAASGVAHDLNNLWTAIAGNAELAQLSPPDDREESHRSLSQAVDQASALTSQLMELGGQKLASGPVALDVAARVRAAAGLLRGVLPSNIEVHEELEDDLPLVRGPATAIEQILLNLVANARDAMPNGGRLTVRATSTSPIARGEPPAAIEAPSARPQTLQPQPAERQRPEHQHSERQRPEPPCRKPASQTEQQERAAGGAEPQPTPNETRPNWIGPACWVALSVSDTGAGMDETTRRNALQLSFTTKPVGEGSGLGLGVVQRLARRCGGELRLESEPGQGTTAVVFMRAAQAD